MTLKEKFEQVKSPVAIQLEKIAELHKDKKQTKYDLK